MLKEFYKDNTVGEKDRIPLEKNILLIVPEKGYDVAPMLDKMGLSKWEVAVTWPKEGVNLLEEVRYVEAKLVVQIDSQFTEDYWCLPEGYEVPEDLLEEVRQVRTDDYVCLHHHDEFSIKDGLGTIEGLVDKLKAQRRSFCCVTNHGSVGGWIKQYNACRKAGIKTVFGMEAYFSDYRGDDMEQKKAHRKANHLILMARTQEGFDNIIRIHNDAQLNGFYYTPRTNREALVKWGKGIVASSACMAGELPRALVEGDEEKAYDVWKFYSEVFDKFYVEIQILEYEPQREANRRLIEFAKQVQAPLLLTCDSHYLEKEHSETHDLLMMIRQGKTVMDKVEENEDVWNFDVKNMFYRNAKDMREVFIEGFTEKDGTKREPFLDDVFTQEVFDEAMANTRQLALEAENIKLDSSIKLPKLYDDGGEVLLKKVKAGLRRFIDRENKKAREPGEENFVFDGALYQARIKQEFDVIAKLGWTDYFLIMEKIISDTVKEHGEWAVGYGRGSAAGSLISYLLGITDVDPIKYGLLFERFLDEGRPDPPDIDTDFDPRIRDWVKRHIVELFGEDKVCSIGTYQTYRTRAVILDVARVLGLDLGVVSNVTKRIDPLRTFEDEDGEEAKVDKLSFDELCRHYRELDDYFHTPGNEGVRPHAEILRNQVKNMGTHAGGVIISGTILKDRIPVLYDKPSSENRQIISAWAESGNASELSAVGLVKYDILGLNNLPVISDCVKLIEKSTGERLPREEIPIDDGVAIKNGSKDLVGIFQLENPSIRSVVDKVRMTSLNDVAAVTSLIRPGPRDNKMDIEYAERKHDPKNTAMNLMPPILREMWKETYGVLTYQEQCMKVSRELCGFTGPEANKLRKAIGKKLPELMAEMKGKFIKGAGPKIDAGEITAEEVEAVWDNLEKFAGYGFNKSHAICYSAISTVEMWLKEKHIEAFCTALINNTKLGKKKHGSEDVMVDYVNYARRKKIKVLSPDVNKSEEEFTLEGKEIRFSIGHVKNVATAAEVIVKNRPYTSVQDFYDKAKTESIGESGKKTVRRLNKKVVESLIAAGAFDSFGTRNEVMAEFYKARKEKAKDIPADKTDEEWAEAERECLGLGLSEVPLCEQYVQKIKEKNLKEISDILPADKRIMVFGQVRSVVPRISKNGNPMFIVKISDGINELEFMVFTSSQQYFKDMIKIGYVAGMPLTRFDDGDRRFFDERGQIEVLDKEAKVSLVEKPKVVKKNKSKPANNRVKTWDEGRIHVDFDEGTIDNWLVLITCPWKKIVKDYQYFEWMMELVERFGREAIEGDLKEIFEGTGLDVTQVMSDRISELAGRYEGAGTEVGVFLTAIYCLMLAENNREINGKPSILGARIKMLGIYQVLNGEATPMEAANYTKKYKEPEISEMCKSRGF